MDEDTDMTFPATYSLDKGAFPMTICFPDAGTVGTDIDASVLSRFGNAVIYTATSPDEMPSRLADADIIVTNKSRLPASLLEKLPKLKLVCITATGYDNVDTVYAKAHGIAVCNVEGYSTDSVAQVTVGTVLSLVNHAGEYDAFCKSGAYTASGIQNRLTPVFHELAGKTWGIYGYGAIGQKVGMIARAFGCELLVCKRTPINDVPCVTLAELFEKSDIISLHTPLNDGTRRSVNEEILSRAKPSLVLVNAARGAVLDEEAVTRAVLEGRIAAFGTDVYDGEPMAADSPFTRLCGCGNVVFTPHMAWGAYEARVRLMEEILQNIASFLEGGSRGRVV